MPLKCDHFGQSVKDNINPLIVWYYCEEKGLAKTTCNWLYYPTDNPIKQFLYLL